MLHNTTVADYLTEQLNAVGMAKEFKFKVFADAAEFEKSWTIQGVLVDFQSEGLPVRGVTARTYNYGVSFNVIDHQLGTRTKAFNDVVTQVVANLQGTSAELDGGRAIFVFDTPTTRGVGKEVGLGEVVYTGLQFKVVYTENVTTTSSKVWTLDGAVIPYLEEGIELEKQGATNSVYGLKSSRSLPIKQTKYYRFVLPFDNSSPICAQLQRDMLEGDMTKTYTLSYYDGVSYTRAEPYTTTVSLFRTGKSGASTPAVSNFTVVFTDTDDGKSGPVLYEMALIDNPFDEGTVNTRYFASKAEQDAWFAAKIAAGAPFSPIKAPNLNSLTITQQVYILAAGSPIDLNSLLMKNYAIIKAIDKASGVIKGYFYYFVQTANVGTNNQILVDLKMDTIQTFFFNPELQIAPCMIQRAHLNRWIDNGDGTVSFNGSPQSPLFEREGGVYPKRLINRKKITLLVNKGPGTPPFREQFNAWLNQNVQCWVYVFLVQVEGGYTFYDENFPPVEYKATLPCFTQLNERTLGRFQNPYSIVCFPLYKTDKVIKVSYTGSSSAKPFEISYRGFEHFLNDNEPANESTIYQIKLSSLPPFAPDSYTVGATANQYDFVDGNLYLYRNSTEGEEDSKLSAWNNLWAARTGGAIGDIAQHHGLLAISHQNVYKNDLATTDIDLGVEMTFKKSEIIGSKFNPKFNPKLLSEDFMSLRITNYNQNFEYDIQKLNVETANFYYSEVIAPGTTQQYMRYAPPDLNGIYSRDTALNFTGLVGASDNSMPFSKNQLNTYLANYKNFFLQRNIDTGMAIARLAAGTLTGGASGGVNMANATKASGVMGAALQLGGVGLNALMGAASIATERIQSNLTLDNMKNAPEMLSNANGNALFMAGMTDLAVYAEIYSALQNEMEMAASVMNLTGFAYNRLGDLKDFVNLRHYFNFIQAN